MKLQQGVTRRDFFKAAIGAAAGAVLLAKLPATAVVEPLRDIPGLAVPFYRGTGTIKGLQYIVSERGTFLGFDPYHPETRPR